MEDILATWLVVQAIKDGLGVPNIVDWSELGRIQESAASEAINSDEVRRRLTCGSRAELDDGSGRIVRGGVRLKYRNSPSGEWGGPTDRCHADGGEQRCQ